MATIYEITGNWRQVYDMADDIEMDPELWFDTMEAIEGELEVKAEGYVKIIKQLEADAAAIKEEKNRLAAKQSALENRAQALKDRLTYAMKDLEKDEIKTDLFKIKIQQNPPSVFIPDESLVPEEFLVPQPAKIDKKSILSMLKDGVEVDWAEMHRTVSIRIR